MKGVELLDHINFDNGHFDDNAIDYIEESIKTCHILKEREASY